MKPGSIDYVQVHFQRLRNSRSRDDDVASANRSSVVARSVEFVGFFHNPWFAAFRIASAPKSISTANHDEPASTSSIVKEPRCDPIRQYWPGWGRTAYTTRGLGGVKRTEVVFAIGSPLNHPVAI